MKFVVIGGGIAGVSCVKGLLDRKDVADEVTLISSSSYVKTTVNWIRVGQFSEYFDVKTVDKNMFGDDSTFSFIQGLVNDVNSNDKVLQLSTGEKIEYDFLCLATGAVPICPFTDSRILTLRDTDSAVNLQSRLKCIQNIAIVGNGGIATELVFELKNVNIHWIIRDSSISSPFFPPRVSKFLEDRLKSGRTIGEKTDGILRRPKYSAEFPVSSDRGCSLGPDWSTVVSLCGSAAGHQLNVLTNCEVEDIDVSQHILRITTNDKRIVDCDLVIWATGVKPDSSLWSQCIPGLEVSEDGGITVDSSMRTSVNDIYACGDVCTVDWTDKSDSWKQMRLWTQARQMGDYCARSMLQNGAIELDFCFELFAHVTNFCGFKIVLLGDFKAENHKDPYFVERIINDEQYVCCVMVNHRAVGAVLIGETDLEETIENLILNRTDLEAIESNFLDPGIDIEDYFD